MASGIHEFFQLATASSSSAYNVQRSVVHLEGRNQVSSVLWPQRIIDARCRHHIYQFREKRGAHRSRAIEFKTPYRSPKATKIARGNDKGKRDVGIGHRALVAYVGKEIYNWASEASPPSRTNGTIFLHRPCRQIPYRFF